MYIDLPSTVLKLSPCYDVLIATTKSCHSPILKDVYYEVSATFIKNINIATKCQTHSKLNLFTKTPSLNLNKCTYNNSSYNQTSPFQTQVLPRAQSLFSWTSLSFFLAATSFLPSSTTFFVHQLLLPQKKYVVYLEKETTFKQWAKT